MTDYRIRRHRDGYRMVWPGRRVGPRARTATPQEVEMWNRIRRLERELAAVKAENADHESVEEHIRSIRSFAMEVTRQIPACYALLQRVVEAAGMRAWPEMRAVVRSIEAAMPDLLELAERAHHEFGVIPWTQHVPTRAKLVSGPGKMAPDAKDRQQEPTAAPAARPRAGAAAA